jgi:hypothetical protein
MTLVRAQQMAALPISVMGGRIIKTATYPTLVEVRSEMEQGI